MTANIGSLAPKDGRRGALPMREVRTLALTAIGGALEYYDFIVVIFFTKVLARVFFPPQTPTWVAQLSIFCIFAAGYLVRPIGGLFFAHFGDRLGRKRMFTLSLFLMVLPTFCVGILPGFNAIGVVAPLLLLVCRILQGMSVGGEVPGAYIFASEHVKADRVGLACALVNAGICSGMLLGSLSATALNSLLSGEQMFAWGWRLPFVVGGVSGFVAAYFRRFLQETPVFESLKTSALQSSVMPIKTVLMHHFPTVVMSALCTWVFSGTFVVFFLYMPTYLQTQWHLEPKLVFAANSWSILLFIVGSICAGWLVGTIGWARTFFWGNLLTAVLIAFFFHDLARRSPHALDLYIVMGFFFGVIIVVPYIIVSAFPASIRFTGFSISYNTAYALFGGTTPVIMAVLVGGRGVLFAPLIYIATLALLGMTIGFSWNKKPFHLAPTQAPEPAVSEPGRAFGRA
jgi:predicted MFS family arabinose efflux permease